MSRKASFKVVNATKHSTNHNKRIKTPSYVLINHDDTVNEYKQIHSDEAFIVIAETDYNNTHSRRMQQKQKDTLIKETVVNLEDHHTLADVENLFKNLNKKYGGHYPIDFSLHNDEGHYVDEMGISYYMDTHIKKIDDDYFIVPLEKFLDPEFKPKKKDFTEKINIDDFKIVYNKHCHVKYSMYDLDNHKTGRMTKGQVSQRLKFVADDLKLDYKPEEKISSGKKVSDIKKEHDLKRRELIQNLLLNDQITKLEYSYKDMRSTITALENATSEQKRELHLLNSAVKNGKATVEDLEVKLSETKRLLALREKDAIEAIQDLEVAEEQLETKDNVISDLQEKLEVFENVDTENSLIVNKQEFLEHEKYVADLEHKIKVRNNNLTAIIKEIDTPKEEQKLHLDTDKSSFFQHFKLTISSLKAKIKRLFTENQELKEENSALKSQISTLEDENTTLPTNDIDYEANVLRMSSKDKIESIKYNYLPYIERISDLRELREYIQKTIKEKTDPGDPGEQETTIYRGFRR